MIKHFRFGVILRVVFLFGTIALWVWLVSGTEYYVSIAILGVIVLFQVFQLIHYVERTNRHLTRFLDSIRYSDFSRAFHDQGLGASFSELNEAFSRVVDKFRAERTEKEEHFRYLNTVVQHIGIGLICFNHRGEVELINTAAKRLFDIPVLRNIKALGDLDKRLLQSVLELKGGNRTLTRTVIREETLQLAIYATEFKMQSDLFKLVSFQNIHTELEEKEMEAWHNLTKVLAHEIMNSITPIASLSDTVHTLLEQKTRAEDGRYTIEKEALKDVRDALQTINKRSHGLMRFVNSYRDFTQIPEPDFEIFPVRELLERVRHLNMGEAASQKVSIEIEVDPASLRVTGDPQLIEQALINLVKNAFQALGETDDARITLSGAIDPEGRVLIQVHDNGPGIKKSNLNKIFIPFFSTSQPNSRGGSGIGLSLSRQIMRMHKGALTVQSEEGEGTTFTLRF